MRVTGAQPGVFFGGGRIGFLEKGHFDKHFIFDIKKKSPKVKNFHDFSLR